MSKNIKTENTLVFSYLTLRKVIGILGTGFPFLLYFGALILFGTGIQDSISSYYYTNMGDVFVGTLCVIGFFLLSYKGYEFKDDLAGDLACIFAIGVALFPTPQNDVSTSAERTVGIIHFVFAALFFTTLIYFSMYLFTKSDPDETPTPEKLRRNKVYKICGYAMILSIVFIIVYFALPDRVEASVEAFNPVFWLESIAVVAFGISWLTKGEAISPLNDDA